MSMESETLVRGLLWFAAFLFSTTVHEAAHALAALRGGDTTAYLGGQVSLSPLPHIRREPIGMLGVPLLTAFTNGWALGWASTPYDPYWAARHPRRAAVMAAAGPAGNLLIALVAFAVIKIGLSSGFFVSPDHVSFHHVVEAAKGAAWLDGVGDLLTGLVVLDALLFVVNVLRLRALDGAAAIGRRLPARAARVVRGFLSNPAFSLLGFLVAWQIFPHFAGPFFGALLKIVHPADAYS